MCVGKRECEYAFNSCHVLSHMHVRAFICMLVRSGGVNMCFYSHSAPRIFGDTLKDSSGDLGCHSGRQPLASWFKTGTKYRIHYKRQETCNL